MAFETTDSERWDATAAAGSCQDHADGDLDAIFGNWHFLAAVAWRGYQTLGRGAVVVNVSSEAADVTYAGGVLLEGYTRYVERYDPLEGLVIVVRHATGEHVYQLSGRPSPRECFETGSLIAMNANASCVPCSNWEQ